ncbi:MAG: LysR family transcriptional regulator [Burkholderiales bacterium]|nr:LysR family transcriptional regulator [Burkholderiales bacterium]
MKRLPPLASLEAFEAAARLGNFSRAATERHLTHSAISRHIQSLEHWYGEALFLRSGPRVMLTDAGHALARRLMEPLEALHTALGQTDTPEAPLPLRIHTLPSLAQSWLVPRLSGFQAQYPNITLSIHTDYELVSLPPHTPAMALRYGVFDRDGLATDMLFSERMIVAAAPAWLAIYGRDPTQWPPGQMLRHTDTPWPAHLPGPGRRRVRLPSASGMAFNDALLLVHATLQGLGVGWLREGLARDALTRGTLEALPKLHADSGRAYWLAYRTELALHPAITTFRNWLFDALPSP